MSDIISLQTANEEIRTYLKNFSKASKAIQTITDAASKEFYNGPEISFVFERNVIEALWELNPEANGLRIYYGSYPQDTEIGGTVFLKGTPTAVLIACKITKDKCGITGLTNLIYSKANAGGEWPDGRGKGPMNLAKSDDDFNVEDDNF